MSRRAASCLIAVVILANCAATILYSGIGPNVPTDGEPTGNTVLRRLSDFLTLPIATPGITDVRDVALIASLGLAAIVVLIGRGSPTNTHSAHEADGRGTGCSIHGTPQDAVHQVNPAAFLVAWSGLGVVGLAVCSAFANGTLDLSWGWILRFAAGAAWAVLIARTFTPGMIRRTLLALLIAAACCMALAIADRAERELAHFRWPIGPITITAALAAVWAATAGAWAAARAGFRAFRVVHLVPTCVCLLGAFVMQQTGRRSPAIGLIAAALLTAAIFVWNRWRSRRVRTGIVTIGLLAVGAGVVFVTVQLRSPDREVSGPLALRLAYWQLSAGFIADDPVLGSGPDTFPVRMTNAVAPLRAESPHFYHGDFSQYAHNEWIQAAVELGVPAALVYIAMPIGVIVLAVRRLGWHPDEPVLKTVDCFAAREGNCGTGGTPVGAPAGRRRHSLAATAGTAVGTPPGPRQTPYAETGVSDSAITLALIAGIIAILVNECASITLRTPMMPAWYWTLIGLLAALCRRPVTPDAPPASARFGRKTATLGLALLAAACLGVSTIELTRAVAQGRKQRRPDGRFASRIYADKTIPARYTAAVLASQDAFRSRPPRDIATVVALWRDLHDTIPALHDVPTAYAQALVLAGRPDAARRVLEDALSERLNPYSVAANTFYASEFTNDPVDKLRCVQRALRAGSLSSTLEDILDEVLAHPSAVEYLERELSQARVIAGGSIDEGNPLTAELLRISAFRHRRAGRLDEAVADQRLAAEYYRRIEQQQDRRRRAAEAETDAFLVLSQLIYDADRADYREAFDAVIEAERYAVLGIMHEHRANPQPEYGFVWGVEVPTEFPKRLYPLWRFSALLHIVVGADHYLDGRIYASLPPDQRTPAELDLQLARLARQAHADLSLVPQDQRPAHFDVLQQMARRYQRPPPDAPDAPIHRP